MKYEKFEKWMIGKKVTHVVTLSSGVIVDISYEGEPDFHVKVKYDDGILAGETSWAFLRNLEFLEGKPSNWVSAQEDSQVNWEVGQVVWDTAFGEGEVVSVEEDYTEYPVKVRFKNDSVEDYTKEGKIFKDCKRCLFFSEPTVTAELFPPKKPSKYQVKDKAVAFEVVELWYNSSYEPYTLVPESENSVKNYAIKIGDYFFLLGDYNDAIFVCDYEGINENQ